VGHVAGRVAAGIITWRDGAALDAAIASVATVVDELVFCDGLIAGIDAHGLPAISDRARLDAYHPTSVLSRNGYGATAGVWPSQAAKRQAVFDETRRLGCDWLLAIDADEALVEPAPGTLRRTLAGWPYDAYPLPFYVEDDWPRAQPAAYKCLHVADWQGYVADSSLLLHRDGEIYEVIGSRWLEARELGLPYLVHNPDLRDVERRPIRLAPSEQMTNCRPWPEPELVRGG
jgi:hypothetical protein